MPAGRTSLYIEKGATYRKTLYWQIGEPPAPVDLSTYIARMMIRNGAGALLIELTTENDRIVLGGEPGRIDLHISAIDTETLAGTSGVFDIEMVEGTEVIRLIEGGVQLSPEVTHP